jgi:hypothetical protein
MMTAALALAAQPVIDNERVTVWDVTGPAAEPHQQDFLTIYLAGSAHKRGDAVFSAKGVSKLSDGERAVVIELKDHQVPPLPNTTGYQLAFPRPHVKKLLENNRIVVWNYAWNPGEPTPMHFHDKDVVVVYLEDTPLKSITPDGQETINDYKNNQIRFNPRNRTHTELLVKGTGSATMMELK